MTALARISTILCIGSIWWRFLLVVVVAATFPFWSLAGPEWAGPASDFFFLDSGELLIRHRDGNVSTIFASSTYYLDHVDRRGEGFVAVSDNIDPVATSTMLLLTRDGKITSAKSLDFEVNSISVRPGHPDQAILVIKWPKTAIFRLVMMSGLGSKDLRFQDLAQSSVFGRPEWSPEGVEFAYGDQAHNIVLHNWIGQRNNIVARRARSATWLGRGRTLCYMRKDWVFQQDLNSGKEIVLRRVYFFEDGIQAIKGSLDGKELLYRAGTDFSASVGVMEACNGRVHKLLRIWSQDIGWLPST